MKAAANSQQLDLFSDERDAPRTHRKAAETQNTIEPPIPPPPAPDDAQRSVAAYTGLMDWLAWRH